MANKKLDKLQRQLYYDRMVQEDRLQQAGSIFDSLINNIDKLLKILNKSIDGKDNRNIKSN